MRRDDSPLDPSTVSVWDRASEDIRLWKELIQANNPSVQPIVISQGQVEHLRTVIEKLGDAGNAAKKVIEYDGTDMCLECMGRGVTKKGQRCHVCRGKRTTDGSLPPAGSGAAAARRAAAKRREERIRLKRIANQVKKGRSPSPGALRKP